MLINTLKNFESIEIIKKSDQTDYQLLENKDLIIFIYGYPIELISKSWLTPNTVIQRYINEDWDYINEIDGIYSIVIIDKRKKIKHIITDRIGIYTLFYFKNEEQFILSDNIKEIKKLVSVNNINIRTALEIINLGAKIGNKTLFNDILEFEPAKKYTIDSSFHINQATYWSIFDVKDDDKLTKEEFREVFNNNLDIVTNLEPNVVLPISGGKDTRMLLSSILDKKDKLRCYTFGPSFHSDVIQSKKICEKLQIEHSIIESNEKWAKKIDFTKDLANMNVNGIGPYFFNLLVKEACTREQSADTIAIQGDLGNQLWRHHPFGNSCPENIVPQDAALWILKHITRVLYFKDDHTSFYSNLYKDKNISDIQKTLQESIMNDLKNLDNPQKPSDYSELFIMRTLGYNFYSNVMKFIGKYFKLYLSTIQKDLLKQLHLLNINERVKGEYIDYIIDKNNAYLASLPYYNSGRVVKYIKMISNAFAQQLFKINLFKHPELHNFPLWIRKYHSKFFKEILDYDKMVLSDLFNRTELEKQIDIFLNERYSVFSKRKILYKYSNQHFVYNLFNLEHWLQKLQYED